MFVNLSYWALPYISSSTIREQLSKLQPDFNTVFTQELIFIRQFESSIEKFSLCYVTISIYKLNFIHQFKNDWSDSCPFSILISLKNWLSSVNSRAVLARFQYCFHSRIDFHPSIREQYWLNFQHWFHSRIDFHPSIREQRWPDFNTVFTQEMIFIRHFESSIV